MTHILRLNSISHDAPPRGSSDEPQHHLSEAAEDRVPRGHGHARTHGQVRTRAGEGGRVFDL